MVIGGRGRKPPASYIEYIKSPKWKLRRQAYFTRHARRCRICKSGQMIQLHHMDYSRLGRELDSDLVPLCKKHHDKIKTAQRMARHLNLRQVTLLYISNKTFRSKVDNAKG